MTRQPVSVGARTVRVIAFALCATPLACAGGGPTSADASAGGPVDRVGVRAMATLEPLALAPADGGVDPSEITGALIRHAMATGPVTGEATFTATREGVDLFATTTNCIYSRGYPLHVVAAESCAQLAADGATWERARGETPVAVAACTGTSAVGRAYASRASTRDERWTIAADASSDLVGRLLVVSDLYSLQPIACGPIVSAPAEPPAEDDAAEDLPVALRAAATGHCFFRQPDAPAECSDPAALVQCATTHCELSACVRECPQYLACLATHADPCDGATSCVPDAGCASCLGAMPACLIGYCFDQLACAPPPTPGGPCTTLRECCAIQGDFTEPCLGFVEQFERLDGDRTCIGTIDDWDWNQAIPVACTYE